MTKPKLLEVGDRAPVFEAETNGGQRLWLTDLKGKCVVLFFYPKDNTPGCTREACSFRDAYAGFRKRGVVVLGVSVDPVKSHDRFVDKFQLPFPLVADPTKEIVRAYGVWGEKRFMGRSYEGTHRVTYLIGADGKIARVWSKVKPEGHAAEVLAAVEAMDP